MTYVRFCRGKEIEIDVDTAWAAYESGLTLPEVGKLFDCTGETIRHRFRRANKTMRPRGTMIAPSQDGRHRIMPGIILPVRNVSDAALATLYAGRRYDADDVQARDGGPLRVERPVIISHSYIGSSAAMCADA